MACLVLPICRSPPHSHFSISAGSRAACERAAGRRGGRTRGRGSTPGHGGGVRVSGGAKGQEDPRGREQQHHRQCQCQDPGQEGDPAGPTTADLRREAARGRAIATASRVLGF